MSTSNLVDSKLVRGLGLIAAISIVVGNVIGTGVFLKARVMTCNVGTPGRVIAVWVMAGLLSLAGALTYAELAAMWPRAGGEYVFIREAYGKWLAFLHGWMRFFVASAGSLAALAAGFAIFLNVLMGGTLNAVYFKFNLLGYQVSFGNLQMIALVAVAVVTLINCAAVSVSGNLAAVLTALKVGIIIALGVGALLFASGDWTHFMMGGANGTCEDVSAAARVGGAGFAAAMLGALWAYNGWNEMTFVAGEVQNPQRNIPLALIGGMAIVCVLYIFINMTYFYVLTPSDIASVPAASSVAAVAASRFLGSFAVSLVALAMLTSTTGALHISTMANSRVPYAMARDGLFIQSLARLSPRTHVPVRALIAQALWASVLAISGSYDTLTDYVIFANWIFFGLVTASVFIFRRTMPEAERSYRTWGYPVVPIVFLLVTLWLLVHTLLTAPVRSIIGLSLIALGLPVYYYQSRINQATSQEPATVEKT
jgi:APA family basic amino acid/polyamine antiporter